MKGTFIIDHVPTGIHSKDLFLREIHLISVARLQDLASLNCGGKGHVQLKGHMHITCTYPPSRQPPDSLISLVWTNIQ